MNQLYDNDKLNVTKSGSAAAEMLRALREFTRKNDMMAYLGPRC